MLYSAVWSRYAIGPIGNVALACVQSDPELLSRTEAEAGQLEKDLEQLRLEAGNKELSNGTH